MRPISSQSAGVGITLAAGVMWGTSFPVNKWGLQFIDPITFTFGRLLLSSILFVVVVKLASPQIRWPWRTLSLLGILNTFALMMQYVGQDLTTVSNAALLVNTSAIFVAIGGSLFLKEPVSREKLMGVFFGLFGAFLLTTRGDLTALSSSAAAGDLIIVLSAFLWTGYILINKRSLSSHHTDPLVLSAGVIWISTATATLPVLASGVSVEALNLEAIGILSYTAVFNTILPLYLWNLGLSRISATSSTVLLMIEILVATILGILFFGDSFNPPSAVGALSLAVSFLLVSRESRNQKIRY